MPDDDNLSRGEQTRSAILQAAYDLFLNTGYHGTSMRQIADRAGVALGGIYNHFSSKEEIFKSILVAYHPVNEILPALNKAGGDSAEGILRSAAQLMIERIYERPAFLNLFYSEMVEFRGRHVPDVLGSYLPRVLAFAERLTTHVRDLRPIPAPILVRVFISMILAYILTELFLAPSLPSAFRQNGQHYFMDIFLNGVLRKDEKHG